jgi:hypothetical protein
MSERRKKDEDASVSAHVEARNHNKVVVAIKNMLMEWIGLGWDAEQSTGIKG